MNYELLLFNALKKAEPNYLAEYIFREFKKAEEEYYSKGEFFNGCLNVLKKWEKSIDNSYEAAFRNFFEKENLIHRANGTEEQKNRALRQLERKKQSTSKENFPAPIFTEEKSFIGGVKLAEIAKLAKAMENVLKLAKINNETLTGEKSGEEISEQETFTFKNNFDNIKPTEIYKHFKTSLVDKGYLTKQELNEYLTAAFELKTKPETRFKLKHTPTKQKIYTVFYTYYKDISQKKYKRQKEYAALLGDFFEGYKTEIIQTNWSREYKAKR